MRYHSQVRGDINGGTSCEHDNGGGDDGVRSHWVTPDEELLLYPSSCTSLPHYLLVYTRTFMHKDYSSE